MSRRWFAVGDPQTTFEGFLSIFREKELLGADGSLKSDVGLVSIGDHFDFKSERPLAEVGRDGSATLGWLAGHPAEQVVILMGNHDAARVMELAFETDESFARAREAAADDSEGGRERFRAEHPRIPTPDIARRDYSSFAEHQRALVQELLVAGRMRLACAGRHDGRSVLLTHAGVTEREVKELGGDMGVKALVSALDQRLRAAVDRVRDAWERGERAALDLRPLHVAGGAGREGGGLLYHRPSARVESADAPRRFDPRSLPRELVQICGHTGHKKCLEELAEAWITPKAKSRARGGLRTLTVSDDAIVYDAGVNAPRDGDATMYFIDIEMNSPEVDDRPLFRLEGVVV